MKGAPSYPPAPLAAQGPFRDADGGLPYLPEKLGDAQAAVGMRTQPPLLWFRKDCAGWRSTGSRIHGHQLCQTQAASGMTWHCGPLGVQIPGESEVLSNSPGWNRGMPGPHLSRCWRSPLSASRRPPRCGPNSPAHRTSGQRLARHEVGEASTQDNAGGHQHLHQPLWRGASILSQQPGPGF